VLRRRCIEQHRHSPFAAILCLQPFGAAICRSMKVVVVVFWSKVGNGKWRFCKCASFFQHQEQHCCFSF
jgi:hypothetical protein